MSLVDLLQIIIGTGIIFLIMIQQRGAFGGALFGFQTEFFSKRRGIEKQIFYFTWFLIFLFVLLFIYKLISK